MLMEHMKRSNRYLAVLTVLALVPIVRGYLFGRQRDPNAYAAVDIYNGVQIVATMLMASVVGRRRATVSNLRITRGPTGWLVLYFVFCAISSLWSPARAYSAFRAVEMLVTLLFMGHVLSIIDDRRAALLYLIMFIALTASLGYINRLIRYGEVVQHSGSYTACGAFGAVLALASIKRRVLRFADIKYSMILCIITVVLGTSSASNVSLIVGVLMVTVASRRGAVSVGKLLLLSLMLFFIFTRGFDAIRPYVFPGKEMKNIRSMTGRTSVFTDFLEAVEKRPIIGYGFASGERSIPVRGTRGIAITNSTHNEIISVVVNTGVVGLLFFGMGLLNIGHALYRADWLGNGFAYPILMAMIVGLLNSMTAPMIGSSWAPHTTPFLGIIAYTSIYLLHRHQGATLHTRRQRPMLWNGFSTR